MGNLSSELLRYTAKRTNDRYPTVTTPRRVASMTLVSSPVKIMCRVSAYSDRRQYDKEGHNSDRKQYDKEGHNIL
jgi:hypothetical protein